MHRAMEDVFSLMQSHHNNDADCICRFEPVRNKVLKQQHKSRVDAAVTCDIIQAGQLYKSPVEIHKSSAALAYKWRPQRTSGHTLINLQGDHTDSILQQRIQMSLYT